MARTQKIRIGTRGSKLALRQTEMVRQAVRAIDSSIEIETVIIKTSGEWQPEQGETRLKEEDGGKGQFAKELEEALLRDEIDCAVHSMKDMESHMPDGLVIPFMLPREDPRDVLLLSSDLRQKMDSSFCQEGVLRMDDVSTLQSIETKNKGCGSLHNQRQGAGQRLVITPRLTLCRMQDEKEEGLHEEGRGGDLTLKNNNLANYSQKESVLNALPEGAVIGTASVRRQAFLLNQRPDLKVVPFRGNVDTRLEKLEQNQVDVTLLAAAGLNRLGFQDVIEQGYVLSPEDMLPAAGQGAVGIQIRKQDQDLLAIFGQISCEWTQICVAAERAALAILDGSCHTPIGAFATLENLPTEASKDISVLYNQNRGGRGVEVERGSVDDIIDGGRVCAGTTERQGCNDITQDEGGGQAQEDITQKREMKMHLQICVMSLDGSQRFFIEDFANIKTIAGAEKFGADLAQQLKEKIPPEILTQTA